MNFDSIIDTATLSTVISVVIVPFINGIKYLYKTFFNKELGTKANVIISAVIPFLSSITIFYFKDALLIANLKEIIITFIGILILSQQIYKSTNKFVQSGS